MPYSEIPVTFEFKAIGESQIGHIAIAEKSSGLPFDVKRVYWTYYTPNNVIRGHHAHKALEQLIFAVSGTITILTEDKLGVKREFILNEPNKGIYVPPMVWREIRFSHSAVLLCLASMEFIVEDYIRDYDTFKSLR